MGSTVAALVGAAGVQARINEVRIARIHRIRVDGVKPGCSDSHRHDQTQDDQTDHDAGIG